MTAAQITPKHPAIRAYYDKRQQLSAQNVSHELAVREAFKGLLEQMATSNKWTLVIEQKVEGVARVIRPDGTLRDSNTLPRGYWEAKDTRDDLDAEIEKKFTRGYPKSNIIFEDTRRAVLYQSGQRAGEYDLMQPEQVAALITRFLSYTEPNIADFDQAVERFKGDTAPLAEGLKKLIADAHQTNKAFQTAFAAFFELCKTALNPNISRDDVDYIMETFPVVKRKDVASHGSYRTKDTILNIYDQMSALPFMSIPAPKDESATYPVPDVSQWATWLTPPPASPEVAHEES